MLQKILDFIKQWLLAIARQQVKTEVEQEREVDEHELIAKGKESREDITDPNKYL